MNRFILAAALAAALAGCAPDDASDLRHPAAAPPSRTALGDPAWSVVEPMGSAREYHSATRLADGRVLVAGGSQSVTLSSAELYDPTSRTWSATGPMAVARSRHEATLLASGKVLVAGGFGDTRLASAELYDPATGTWSATGSLATARYLCTMTLLPSGEVLVVGGLGAGPLASAELYDPVARTWRATGALWTARYNHTATLLASGKVLVVGGYGGSDLYSAELYDPETGTWSATGGLSTARSQHTATALRTGEVLVVAGYSTLGVVASAELYDPVSATWGATGPLATARDRHTATLLASGKVLVVGGYGSNILATAELYAPDTGIWSAAGSLANARYWHAATLLTSGSVLVTGGWGSAGYLAGAERYVPSNVAPTAQSQSLTTSEDTAMGVTLSSSDADGDGLIHRIVTPPAHGTLTGAGASLTYTPAADFHGTDGFTFVANDGLLDSATATVTVSVVPVNDAPVAQARSASIAEDGSAGLALSASDVDGDALTWAVVTPPAHGTLSLTAGYASYRPAADFNGTDSFSFKVNDGTTDSAPATVSITVAPVADAPLAEAQGVATAEDVPVGITLVAVDADGDALTYTPVTLPAHGALTGSGASLSYAPFADYHGADGFTFKASDGALESSVVTVWITVTAVNDAPVAQPRTASTGEDSTVAITLSATDVEGTPLTYAVAAQPSHGTVSIDAGTATYTPAPDFHGDDGFTFKANDGTVDSAVATVTVTVAAVNDAPVATDQAVTLDEDGSLAVTLAGTDVEGDALAYTVVTPPAHGTLSGTGATLTYTPAKDYAGPDGFTFTVSDGTVDSAPATVSITVTAVAEPGGCSCGTSGDVAPLGALLVGLLGLRRRRRPHPPVSTRTGITMALSPSNCRRRWSW